MYQLRFMSVSGNSNKYCLIKSSFPTKKIIPSQISLPVTVSSKGPTFFYLFVAFPAYLSIFLPLLSPRSLYLSL